MKKIKFLLVSLTLTLSLSAFAEVLEVYQWKADPG